MSRVYTSKKSPWAAGMLSVVPGLGQIYNEQTGKGLVMFFLFLGTFIFFVLRVSLMSLIPEEGWHILGIPSSHFYTGWLSPWGSSGLARIYPLIWFMILLPFFVIFSITDAVQNARRINLNFAPASAPNAASSPPSPPPAHPSSESIGDQDRLRAEAQQKMSENAAASSIPPFSEDAMNNPNANNAPSNGADQTPPKKHARGVSGKFFLGIVLMIIGGIYILDKIDLPIFTWATWNHLWPLIPLLFGLRLLREYQMDKDRGQFVLGAGFSAVGVIFLLENWRIFPAWEFLEDFWMFFLFGVGVLFVLIDLLERRRRRE
ncbi:MAG: hypothetical protein JXR73_20210 [Candidatus Omnitrophica bacterium]|nr:hypothetical protein [Candidatus Omnitrophota bacterium]